MRLALLLSLVAMLLVSRSSGSLAEARRAAALSCDNVPPLGAKEAMA
jgi:hypothetical protein